MNHRYPTRALTLTSGEQLLQKRTRSQIQKPEGKAGASNENQTSTSKKMRTKDFNEFSTQLQSQISYVEHMNQSANSKYQRALQKTNPRMANAHMINPRQGKQLFKDQQSTFMPSASPNAQQNQFMHQGPQLMNMNPFGMQMPGVPMMSPMPQIPQMSPMNQIPQMPQMVNGSVNPFDMTNQLNDLQRQLMNLTQMAVHSQMQALNQGQFQNPYMMMGQPGMYPQQMMPQQEEQDDSQETEQIQDVKKQKDDSKINKRKSQSPSVKSSPKKTKSKSPESKSSPQKNQAQNKGKKGVTPSNLKKTENTVAAQFKNTRQVKIQEKAKIAAKGIASKKTPVITEGTKTPTKINKAQLEKQTSNKSSPIKSKLQSEASINEDESQTLPRRLTRHQKNDIEKKPTKKQEAKKVSPLKQKETSTQRTLRSQQTTKAEKSSKQKKISPVRTSPRKTVAKHTRSSLIDLDSTPIRQTRLRAKADHSKSQHKEQKIVTPKAQSEYAAIDRSNVSSTQEQSNILKSLQKEVIMAAKQHQIEKTKQNKSGSRSSERKNKPPTQDEIMLFGESSFQNQPKESSLAENPLINSKSKVEAQTEIVIGKTDNFEQVFTDDEDDQEMKAQLAKERIYLAKGREQIKQIEQQMIPQDKLKDMSQLFGMPEAEVIELAEKQRNQIQKIKDEHKLFGESSDELPAAIKKFDENKKIEIIDQDDVKIEDPSKSNKEDQDELMLFDEQPSGSSQKNSTIQESLIQEKIQDKSSEKINVFSQPKNDDEALLFGSQQKQQVMSIQQEDTPGENTKSFEIEVQQNSPPMESKPFSSEVKTQQPNQVSQQDEYFRKQEELDRQIAEIKRQIEQQQQKQDDIENKLSQPVPPPVALQSAFQSTESQAVEQIEDDHEMVIESQEQQKISLQDQDPILEDKEMEEEAQDEEEQVSDSDVQEIPKQEAQVQEQTQNEHRHFKETLQLSEKLSLLYEFQGTLDQSLNMVLIKNMSSTFTNLKNIIQSTTKRQFNMSHFQQLIKLEPSFFNHRWELKQGRQELIIQHPSNVDENAMAKYNKGEETKASDIIYQGRISGETIKLRQKIMRQDLIKFLASELDERYVDTGFDAYEAKQWPPYFNIEDIDDIQLAELKEQPKAVQKQSIRDFLQTHDTRADVQKAIDHAKKPEVQPTPIVVPQMPREDNNTSQIISASSSDSDDRDSSEEARMRSQKFQGATGISKNTLEAIQMKQKLEREAKQNHELILEKQGAQKKIDQLFQISQQIKTITQFQQGSTIFLSKLLEQMMTGAQRGQFVSREHLKDQIVELTKACPKWISIVQHQMGTMIKVHQNLNFQGYHIKQNIQDHFLNRQEGQIVQPEAQNPRLTKSLPPPQQKQVPSASGIQVYNKPGFQSYQRQQANSLSQDQRSSIHKNMQISQTSSQAPDPNQKLASSRSNSGGNPQLLNQNLYNQINLQRSAQPNYNQYMQQQQNQNQQMHQQTKPQQPAGQTAQQQNVMNSVGISSSSGTFLSGPGAHSGGEASQTGNDREQHLPSKYLSPLKQQHMSGVSGKQSSGFRGEGIAGIGIQFGNDMYQGMQSSESRGRQFSSSSYGHSGYQQQNQYGHQQTGSHQNFYRNSNQKY